MERTTSRSTPETCPQTPTRSAAAAEPRPHRGKALTDANMKEMVKAFRELPPAVRPVYRMSQANKAVRLYKGEIELTAPDGRQFAFYGDAHLQWLPSPAFQVSCSSDNLELYTLALTASEVSLCLAGIGMKGKAFCCKCTAQLGRAVHLLLSFRPEPLVIGGPCQDLVFHVANLRDYLGKPVRYGNRRSAAGRLEFQFCGWQITLDKAWFGHRILEGLDCSGGYGLTHVGRLQRVDRTLFPADEGFDVLEALVRFLSFCHGRAAGIPLSVSKAPGGALNAAKWFIHNIAPWRTTASWSDDRTLTTIEPLFQRFWSLWQDPFWHDMLQAVIFWYVNANQSPVAIEEAIVMSQVALERLAWASMVEKDNVLSPDGFKRLTFADTLKLFLDRLGIPIAVPTHLSNLIAYGKANNLDGIPEIIVGVRNDIVHPTKRGLPGEVAWEVWLASLWCLELAVLALLGYQGQYCSRVAMPFRGPEPVPWQSRQAPRPTKAPSAARK